MRALNNAVSAIRQALVSAQSDLDAIRTRIGELQSERERIAAAPRDRAHVERLVDEMIANARARDPFEIGALWSVHMRPFEAVGSFNDRALGREMPSGFSRGDMLSVLAVWDPQRLKSLIMAHAPEGISEAARAKALAKIDADLLAAEIAEETACRAMEDASGLPALRRSDVQIALVLAPDSELEASS